MSYGGVRTNNGQVLTQGKIRQMKLQRIETRYELHMNWLRYKEDKEIMKAEEQTILSRPIRYR